MENVMAEVRQQMLSTLSNQLTFCTEEAKWGAASDEFGQDKDSEWKPSGGSFEEFGNLPRVLVGVAHKAEERRSQGV